MRRMPFIAALAIAVASTVSCSETVRQGQSPVYLTVDLFQAAQGNKPGNMGAPLNSDVITNVTTPAPCTTSAPCPTVFNDLGSIKLRSVLKNLGANPASPASPTSNNDVTLTRYHVDFVRTDGRNTPGVDVPYGFDGSVTGTIPGGGSATLVFELVRHTSKEESPLVQLISNFTEISTIANVTFYGQDAVGNQISVAASISVNFANFGDQ